MSEVERQGRRVVVPVAVEVAAETGDPEEKSWSEEDPEGFEDAVAHVLDKNEELYRRPS